MSQEDFVERFGRKERSGVGGRSRIARNDQPTDEVRHRLLVELSELREHHESLQRQREEEPRKSEERFDPNLFGNNASAVREDWQLGENDKDAIEALFASDDFAEMFNAGGQVSRFQAPVRQPVRPVGPVAPICHNCFKKLSPHDIAAYISKSFDPFKPTARRRAK